MPIFRVSYKDSSTEIVTGTAMNQLSTPIDWELVECIKEVGDYQVSSTILTDSKFKLVRMASGDLWLHPEPQSPVKISKGSLVDVAEKHIVHLQGHIDGLNRKLQELEQSGSNSFRQLRELCGYIQNDTDTKISIFQNDTTGAWNLEVGHESNTKTVYTGDTIELAIQNATEQRK